MAFDQSSVPMDLRPINVARVEPRFVPTTVTGGKNDGFPANQASAPNPTPFYYPVGVAEPRGFVGEVFGNPNQLIPNSYPPGPSEPSCNCSSSSNSANLPDQGGNRESKNDPLTSGKRPKFLCSFGGKILPRPGSGVLRYVGGHTRLIGFKGNINFDTLAKKMMETCGQPVAIKYQLPGEDLDALVSITSQEDFDIMMEEYDKIISSLPDGSAKLRLYLFSTSDAGSSGLDMLSYLNDDGQKYVNAINGILDDAGGVITRKESLDSAASAQNSDLGGNETVDCSGQAGQGNAMGPPNTGAPSFARNSSGGISQENTTREVAVELLSSNTADASAIRLGIPVVASSVQISNSELELEKSVFPTMLQQTTYETKHTLPTSTPCMRACVPQQNIKGLGDSVHVPSRIGFPQPPIVGNPGSVFQQHQPFENAVSAGLKQFMPAMTTSGTTQVLRPNAVQQMMYPSQNRRDNYPEGVAYPLRVVPLDPSYIAYQAQVPQSVVGGAYGWNMSTPNHTVFHERLASPQQVVYTSNVTRMDDYYMCQKALPHAHSDSLAQQLKDGIDSPTSDSNHSYYSLQSEVSMRTLPSNMAWTTGGSREVFDEQSSGTWSRALNQANNQVAMPLSPFAVYQNVDAKPENERTSILVTENLDHPKLPVSQGVLPSSGHTPCSAPINNMLQPHLDINFQQYSAPTQFQAKQSDLVNMPIHSEVFPTTSMPSQTPEHLSHESPKKTSGKSPGAVPKEDILDLSTDNNRKPNQSTKALRVCSPEHVINTESGKFDGPLKSDMLDQKPQQNAGRDIYLDSIFSTANIVFEPNQVKPTDTSPCFSELPNSTSQTSESYAVPVQPITGYAVDSSSAISARKDDASQFHFTESVTSNGHALSCIMPPKIIENDVQDSNPLFSIQDPLPPPKPTSTALKNEAEIQDPLASAFLKKSHEVKREPWLEDPVRLPSENIISDSKFENGPSEELIKRELQTEGVAASNLHTAPPPLHTDLSSDASKELLSKAKQERERNSDSEQLQYPKLEDIKAKLPDKTNFGFPTSDLGRLQIINNKDLEELRELGSGTFGTVYHGKWRGTDVAIKRINNRCFQGKPSEQEHMRDDFWNEAIKLADLHHPNVLAFYGVVLDGPGGSVATVTEYMVNGSLRNALRKNERSLDKRKRILIAMDVAFGMEYLHGKNIVHFDLKSDNLLVNLRDPHRPICKVSIWFLCYLFMKMEPHNFTVS
uniref:Protein kinase domain-containing protein n=1 Tax=Kalanchoe fedtschenkoi TaxID=63787 RepID=A0A7N0VBP9_KALFE